MALDTIGLRAVFEGGAQYIGQIAAAERAEKNLAAQSTRTAAASGALAGSSDEAAAALDRTGKSAGTTATKMDALEGAAKKASMFMGIGFAAAIGLAVKAAADFEHQMDQVGAVAGATEDEIAALSDVAKQIGAETAFSAGEAAAAMEELAAGGRSVAQIMGGEARAAVDLAAAGNYNLADSATAIATTMDIWKTEQLEANEVVNQLAAAANVSKFGVEDMAAAIAQGGGAAATAGVEFDDFAASVAATASSFSSGSDAGTSFKTFVLNLTGSSNEAKEAIKDLGLEFFTAQGTMKPMAEIVQELHDKVGPLSEELQTVYLKQIFGNDAFRTAAALMKMTGDEFATMSNTMKTTDASEIAKQRMDNMKGSIEELKGSLETLGISIGEKTIPALTEVTEMSTQLVNKFSELDASTQGAILGFTGIALAAGKFSPKAGLLIGSLGAIVTLVDILVERLSGEGIFSRILEDFDDDHAQAVKTKMEEIGKAMSDPNFAGEPLVVLRQRLMDTLGAAQSLSDALKTDEEGFTILPDGMTLDDVNKRFSDLSVSAHAYVLSMKEAGASSAELAVIHAGLSGRAQELFDKWAGVTEATKAQNLAYEEAGGILAEYELSLSLLNDSLAGAAPATQAAISPTMEWVASLGEVDDVANEVKEAIDGMIESFADLNPAVAGLKAENAFLVEEMDDLLAKGEEMTQADKDRVAAIEEVIAANDKQIEGYESNQKALEGARQALENYIGPAGLGAVLSKLQELNVPQEDQIALLGETASAYQLLSEDKLPEAVAAFDDVKAGLDPAVWGPLAEAIGPDLVRAIDEGVTDPVKKQELYDAVAALVGDSLEGGQEAAKRSYEIGIQIANGLAAGLRAGIDEATAAARELAGATTAELDGAFIVRSPSKWAINLGKEIVNGLVIGLETETNASLSAVTRIALKLQERLEALLAPGSDYDETTRNAIERQLQGLYIAAVAAAVSPGTLTSISGALAAEGTASEAKKAAGVLTKITDEFGADINDSVAVIGGQIVSSSDEQRKADKANLDALLARLDMIRSVLTEFGSGVISIAGDLITNDDYLEVMEQINKIATGQQPVQREPLPGFDPSQLDPNVSAGYYAAQHAAQRAEQEALAAQFGVSIEELLAMQAKQNEGIDPLGRGPNGEPGVIYGQASKGRYILQPDGTLIEVPEGTYDPTNNAYYWDNAWHYGEPPPAAGGAGTQIVRDAIDRSGGQHTMGGQLAMGTHGEAIRLYGENPNHPLFGGATDIETAVANYFMNNPSVAPMTHTPGSSTFNMPTDGSIFDGGFFNRPMASRPGDAKIAGSAATIIFDLSNAQLGSNTREVGEEFERRVRAVLSEESGRSAFLAGVSAPLRRREV